MACTGRAADAVAVGPAHERAALVGADDGDGQRARRQDLWQEPDRPHSVVHVYCKRWIIKQYDTKRNPSQSKKNLNYYV